MDATEIQILIDENINELAKAKRASSLKPKGFFVTLAEIGLFSVAVLGAYTTLGTLRLIKRLR